MAMIVFFLETIILCQLLKNVKEADAYYTLIWKVYLMLRIMISQNEDLTLEQIPVM